MIATFIRGVVPSIYKRTITIDHTKCGSSDSTNFSILVSVNDTTMKTITNGGHVNNSNGYDIVFYSDSGYTSIMNWECEFYDPVNGIGIFWVLVSTVSHTSDTVFYMRYGDTTISTFQGGLVGSAWNSNQKGIWHLPNGTTLSANDSTSNGNNGTINGTVSSVTGKIDGGASIANGSNYIKASNSSSLQMGSIVALSAWVNPSSRNSNFSTVILKRADLTEDINYNYSLWLTAGGNLFFQYAAPGPTEVNITDTGTAVPLNTWSLITAVKNQSSNNIKFYLNGALNSTKSDTGTMTVSGTGNVQLGNYGTVGGGVFSLKGSFDEVRINNSDPGDDWWLTEYNNENSPGNIGSPSFLTFGSETT